MQDFISNIAPDFPSYISGFSLYIALALLGFIIGLLAGMFGVGGGFLLVPSINILLGIPVELAAGSVTCYIIGTSSTGLIKHIKMNNVALRAVAYMSTGSIFGAVMGDILQDWLIQTLTGGDRLLFDRIMQVFFIIILSLVAVLMWIRLPDHITRKSLFQRIMLPPRTILPRAQLDGISIPGLVMIGSIGGLLNGLMGVSGGVIFLPILILGVGLTAHMAVGTSMGVVLFGSMAAVIKKSFSGEGKISLPVTLALLLASALGVRLGIKLGQILHSERLKRYFVIVVILAIIMVVINLVRGFVSSGQG